MTASLYQRSAICRLPVIGRCSAPSLMTPEGGVANTLQDAFSGPPMRRTAATDSPPRWILRRGSDMPVRNARTEWTGGLQDGSGSVALSSSGAGTFDVSWPRRAADDAEGVTSPEELIAAAHSSCYSMQLSAMLTEAGGTVKSLVTDAAVR